MNKVVLAYSGGLDTSVAVAWLREQFGVEVVTLTVDVGGGSLREGVERRAMSAGASRAYVVDARERFVTDFVWPHLQANALYQGAYPLATALARPLIAQLLVEVAQREGADAVAHGCTGKGNDQVRFDVAVHALDPGLEVVAPMRVGMGLTRDQEIDYANERGIEIPITKASPYSIDVNLWGRSCETGVLEDPWVTPPADAYEWTAEPSGAPAPVELEIGFEGGVPVSLDGERLEPLDLVQRISTLAGQHGVGRIDHVEDRLVGIKSREIYEAPAAVVLHAAHRALEGLTLTKDTLRFNALVADELSRLIYDGLWFSALSRDLRTYVASSQRVVSGDVRIRLDHGSAVLVGRRSPLSLYDKNLATYDEGDAFDHASAVGFIEIFGLPLRVEAARHGAVGRHHGAAWTWTEPLLASLPVTVADPTEEEAAPVG
jgi:argininosuccinate synthase